MKKENIIIKDFKYKEQKGNKLIFFNKNNPEELLEINPKKFKAKREQIIPNPIWTEVGL
jgi:hypothetical protein